MDPSIPEIASRANTETPFAESSDQATSRQEGMQTPTSNDCRKIFPADIITGNNTTPESTLPDSTERCKCGSVKNASIVTNQIIEVGEQWKVVQFIEFMADAGTKLYLRTERGTARKATYIFYCFSFLGNCLANFLSLKAVNGDSFLTWLLVLNALFAIVLLWCTGYAISLLFRNEVLTNEYLGCTLIGTMLHFIVSILTAVFLSEVCLVCALTILAFVYASCVFFVSFILAILVLAPFVIIGFIVELCVRIVTGRANCPKKELLVKIYSYQPFRYRLGGFNAKECVICLGKYEEQDEVVVLLCHESHVFHVECILQWLQRCSYCPICRKEAAFVLN